MRNWLRGARGGLLLFLAITLLVGGGLGWMTSAVLRLEREQQQARARAELTSNIRLALWRLDTLFATDLAREEGRPYNHYSFLSRHPRTLVQRNNRLVPDATVLQLSPLLTSELPGWILLHFQADETGWSSPQVPPQDLVEKLRKKSPLNEFPNRTPGRSALLGQLRKGLPAQTLLAAIDQRGGPTTVPDRTVLLAQVNPVQQLQQTQQAINPPAQQPEMQQNRRDDFPGQQGGQQAYDPEVRSRIIGRGKTQQDYQNSAFIDNADNLLNDLRGQGANWFNLDTMKKSSPIGEVTLRLTAMVPAWVKIEPDREFLVLVREVVLDQENAGRICQGVVLDTQQLQTLLLAEVADLFPEARLEPVRERSQADPLRAMAALPYQLEPGPIDLGEGPAGWTPLRIGLGLAWMAAGVALLAGGLAGWSLIDLSERRFRFVSAVTHELRTPLTTLRLYLDMLLNGLVRDEAQKEQYLQTLHGESDRLSRLVNNVLDFSRLEKQRPNLVRRPVAVRDLLDQVRTTWQGRCLDVGKQLVVECPLAEDVGLVTDGELVQQILGNLIDNACKYSREADDPHIWLRARLEAGKVILEVEDRGPGVPARERRAIFRAFRRGQASETTGGVGLGLALAQRWTYLLGGRLSLCPDTPGACFRVELPQTS